MSQIQIIKKLTLLDWKTALIIFTKVMLRCLSIFETCVSLIWDLYKTYQCIQFIQKKKKK